MPMYQVKYRLKATGYLYFEADSEEEAREEFDRALCGEECQNETNNWIDQDTIFDVEWNGEILDVSEC